MAEAKDLQQQLLRTQNADGGWSYGTGDSWTEPTALSLIALEAAGYQGLCTERGREWLSERQNRDGGWSPCSQVQESTWVTSLAVLALRDSSAKQDRSGLEWLLRNVNQGPTVVQTIAARLRHMPAPNGQGGSPWFPGAAPWVIPTAMSILAFTYLERRISGAPLRQMALDGQRFLWSRRCRDQGWNHGGSFYRSEDAGSYPETTGIALLALTEIPSGELAPSLERARSLALTPGSVEGLSWLELALRKHGQPIQSNMATFACRNNRDVSLRLLALSAGSSTNKFVA